jgi:ubiquinone/menaquinone biosynthesis C-methylase UbiE
LPQADAALPEAEHQFQRALEEWYVGQGVPRSDSLFGHWVRSGGADTYQAGRRALREIGGLTDVRGLRVLDVGCGFGGALVAMAEGGARCVGLDRNPSALELCHRRLALHGAPASLVRGDAYAMPFGDGAFDVVLCMEVLEHVARRHLVIREMARVLRPAGVLYLSFPNLLSVTNVLKDPHYHLAGVVLLPLRLARWYTQLRRGRSYDVEVLPVAPLVARECARHGVRVFSVNTGEEILLRKVAAPASIRHPAARVAFGLLWALGLTAAARGAIRLRAALGSGAVLAGFKE